MRTLTTPAGTVPGGRPRAARPRGAYLEVPGKADATAEVTHEHIERRAYELFLARGAGEGDALGDWLAAERDLKGRAPMPAPLTPRREPDVAH